LTEPAAFASIPKKWRTAGKISTNREEIHLNKEEIESILDKLKNGEINEFLVKKEDFMQFRSCLVKRPDFKHFRGIAQRGGDVLFHYLEEPRK
jgi:hypothetical protein